MGKKSEIFYLPTLKVTKSRVHLHATLTMRAWHSKMSYWRREKRLRKATVTFTQCRAEWLLLMTATGGVECVYLRVCVFMQEWVTIFPCLSVFVFLCLLLWGRQSELLFFWMYVSVPVCGSVCVPRKGTEAKKNNTPIWVKEGDVLEHALTCHIVFVTFEGRAPRSPLCLDPAELSSVVLLQSHNSHHLWDCGAADQWPSATPLALL